MHIVTFYSYKGGVGRTMALVNTAAALAKRGRRVLIVDFDLEAPGISTYSPFSTLTSSNGVVEFVADYIETSVAPKVEDYIVQFSLGDVGLWAMPAGQRNRDYSSRLNSIDWQALYALRKGYLFFEDLKQQWRNLKFDYVLIDSRTGHTDVGGICTRQLPDAVVVMFFPNDQNLVGLENVVKDIREEPRALRSRNILLHFCASNVPDLDDEENILERKLQDARDRLSYKKDPILIHHYNSLTLLEQAIFVLDRPKSKLSAEYNNLLNEIVSENLEDRYGALAALARVRDAVRLNVFTGEEISSEFSEELGKIRELHPKDGEVAWMMAQIYNFIGNLVDEAERLTVAIEQNVSVMTARRRRAAIARLQGRQQDALVDLQEILSAASTTGSEFVAAVEILSEIEPNWVSLIAHSPLLSKLDSEQLYRLSVILMNNSRGANLAVSLIEGHLKNMPRQDPHYGNLRNRLTLALVSSQHFEAAMSAISSDRASILQSKNIVDVFNYAMAEWGALKVPSKDLMQLVVNLSDGDEFEGENVNRMQCLSLAQSVLGSQGDARRLIERAKHSLHRVIGREFSCWRYLEVDRSQMQEDLIAQSDYIENGEPRPQVFASKKHIAADHYLH